MISSWLKGKPISGNNTGKRAKRAGLVSAVAFMVYKAVRNSSTPEQPAQQIKVRSARRVKTPRNK